MSAGPRGLEPGVVHLWVAPDRQLDESVEARYREFMSAEEREAERRFLVEGARRLHVLARGLQRRVLASYLPGTDPAALVFQRSPKGRPSLAPPFDGAGIEFNLAHSGGMVVMAVCAHARLGVDVEGVSKQVPLAAARRYFSAEEVAALDALPADEQVGRFLKLWTLKEAYLKAIGTGIAGGLGSMTFRLEAGTCSFERAADPEASRWQFRQYLLAPDYMVALACLSTAGALRLEWREFFAGEEREVSLVRSNLLWGSGQEEGAEA